MVTTIKSPVFEPIYRNECPRCGYTPSKDLHMSVTDRERDVIALVAQGYSNKMISSELGIAMMTVKNHITGFLNKTGCGDRTSAAMFALEYGLIKRVEVN